MVLVFFGTPAFAVPSLHALLNAGHDVAAVVTQPDRAQGRSRSSLVAPPVKIAAAAAGIPVLQPEKPIGDAFESALRDVRADLGVVVAYGHILRPHILTIPHLGMVNVHASVLPRWRGAAPIERAIKTGDAETGVSIMRMTAGLDSGPVWLVRRTPIGPDSTGGALTEVLAVLGAEALIDTLPRIASGEEPVPQDDASATLAPKIDRAVARIDWKEHAEAVARHINAFDPVPGAWTAVNGAEVKLFAARKGEGGTGNGERGTEAAPGTVLRADTELHVATGGGTVLVREVQPAGKKRQSVAEWVRGRGIAPRARFE